MMKRSKLTRRMLFLLVFFICIVVLLIFAASKLRMPSPSELAIRFIMLGSFLLQKPPPMPPPPDVFRQHILNPIPESVTNIKADKPKEIGGYRYTLRFNISRADLALLINSEPFVRVWNVKYRDGFLSWGWDRDGPLGMSMYGNTIIVYKRERWHREPRWFTLELGANTEVYAFDKVGDRINVEVFEYERGMYDRASIKVLIYNEKEGEAYFIVSSYK